MTHLRLKDKKINSVVANLVAGSLRIGQTVVLPTDTIYGLSCAADNARAIRRVKQLKNSDPKKPLLILVDNLTSLKKYVFLTKEQSARLKKYWSATARPTTVILKHRGLLPKELTGNSDGLAVRLPKSKFLIKMIKAVGAPLVSTSFNLSGEEVIRDLKLLMQYFPKKKCRPDLVLDIGACRRVRPSRLIDLRSESGPIIIRK